MFGWFKTKPFLFCPKCGRETELFYPYVHYDTRTGARILDEQHRRCPVHTGYTSVPYDGDML